MCGALSKKEKKMLCFQAKVLAYIMNYLTYAIQSMLKFTFTR